MRLRACRPVLLAATLLILATPLATAARAEPPQLSARIDELFADVARSDSPGAAVAVIQNGRILYENAFGMADLERRVALTSGSVFEIGSVSKQFTAFCILLLEADGALTLDDDVRTWIPELPQYGRPITIRHLLHHTSGIRDIETLLPLAGVPWVNYYSASQSLDLITRQKGLNFPPGEQHLYSNSGYLLLARIIEEVSGLSLRQFARQRIFEPLGMEHTEFWDDPEQIVTGRALPYSRDSEGRWRQALWNLPFAGPSGLYTTVGDLALWDANFYDNRLGGGPELIARMTTPGVLANGESLDYAAGLSLGSYRGHQLIEHGGAWMGYRAILMRLPEERLTVIVLSNASEIFVRSETIADLLLPEDEEPGEASGEPPPPADASPSVELSPEQLEAWAGTYWNEDDELIRTLEVREGKLFYVRTNGSSTELGAADERSFFMIGPAVRVDVVLAGAVPADRTMTVTVEGDEPLLFHPVAKPAASSLQGLAGTYWSAELGRELQLVLADGRIHVHWSDEARQVPAEFISSEELVVPGFIRIPWNTQDTRLLVERDEAGQVTGLSLSCEMVRGVSLERRPAPVPPR
jgi:CubicO group peptidase (beta-lactamase class C family)